MSTVTLIQADARHCPLADGSVQCVVTSPPYYGLRSYGIGTEHGEIGLEPTIEAYVARLVAVFREVKRVLRDDGVIFVNLGDSFSSGGRASQCEPSDNTGKPKAINGGAMRVPCLESFGSKNLLGIPWRVAFALQADGWILRSEIIWAKPNPMPESVTDRPTKSHEQVFLLTKRERYFYDAEGVKEPISPKTLTVHTTPRKGNGTESTGEKLNKWMEENGGRYHPSARNLRSVWTITPKPFAGAHFATFPAALVERCIKAGTSERGQCPSCGRAWERVVEREPGGATQGFRPDPRMACPTGKAIGSNTRGMPFRPALAEGFRQSCPCPPREPVPQVVFDPFGGAGTVPMVASNLGRRGVMTELNPAYIEIARRRITRPHAKPERVAREEHHPLFAGIEP